MLRLALIYDTSYLMLPSFKDVTKEKKDPYSNEWLPSTYDELVDWTVIVADEVAEEVRSHFDNPEKDKAARVARKRIADLRLTGCREVSLKEYEPVSIDGVLGADSDTDRRLIGLAHSLANSGNYESVFLATDDGGILADLAALANPLVFGLSKENFESCFAHIDEASQVAKLPVWRDPIGTVFGSALTGAFWVSLGTIPLTVFLASKMFPARLLPPWWITALLAAIATWAAVIVLISIMDRFTVSGAERTLDNSLRQKGWTEDQRSRFLAAVLNNGGNRTGNAK